MHVAVPRCAERDAVASNKPEMAELRLLTNYPPMRFKDRDAYVIL